MPTPQAPATPGTPRPGNEPYYVDATCDACDTPLVLFEVFTGRAERRGDVHWHDEWICPNADRSDGDPDHPCSGLVIDAPQSFFDTLDARMEAYTDEE